MKEQIAQHTFTKTSAARTTGDYPVSDDDAMYQTRPPSSTRRYRYNIELPQTHTQEPDTRTSFKVTRHSATDIPRRSSSQTARPSTTRTPQPVKAKAIRRPVLPPNDDEEEEEETTRKGRTRLQVHPLLYLGVGMLVMLALWIGATNALVWWQSYQDSLHYGYPRTYQTDVRVGHHDDHKPSHFIAINLNGHILVVEIQGGDGAATKIYLGPVYVGPQADKHPVLLKFKDINHDGKLDMLVLVNNQECAFVNDQGGFRPLKQGEHADF